MFLPKVPLAIEHLPLRYLQKSTFLTIRHLPYSRASPSFLVIKSLPYTRHVAECSDGKVP